MPKIVDTHNLFDTNGFQRQLWRIAHSILAEMTTAAQLAASNTYRLSGTPISY